MKVLSVVSPPAQLLLLQQLDVNSQMLTNFFLYLYVTFPSM